MKEKNCVVTGGNSGIGFETALALARKKANVIILSRNREKAELAVKSIQAKSQNHAVRYVLADLSSQNSIREAASKILDQFETIDVLVNNAGTWFSKLLLTEDGIEQQFAVNHLAYFLLTHELLAGIHKSDDGRIICVGSDSHFQGKMHFDDLTLGKRYHGLRAYAQSKLANVMFVYELDKRLRQLQIDNITAYCVQPGLVKTDIGLKHTISLHSIAWKVRRLGGVSPAAGAETSIFLASAEEAKGKSGLYWDKCRPKSSSKKSYVEADWERLWQICCEMCHIDNYFKKLH
jgi:retinol dehydrogenase-12